MSHLKFYIIAAILSISTFGRDAEGSPLTQVDSSEEDLGPLSLHTKRDEDNTFKHEALILSSGSQCSGSIIADQYVMTAAHCVVKKNTNQVINEVIMVHVGITRLNVNEYYLRTFRIVEAVYLDKRYAHTDPLTSVYGDIAILKLNKRLGLGENSRIDKLQLPRVPASSNFLGRQLMYTGFGITGLQLIWNLTSHLKEEVAIPAEYLHFSEAEVLENSYCDSWFSGPSTEHWSSKLCGRLQNQPTSMTCAGDSGSGLYDATTKEIIGVLSGVGGSCYGYLPTFYTKVSTFLPWINAALNDNVTSDSVKFDLTGVPDYQSYARDQLYSRIGASASSNVPFQ